MACPYLASALDPSQRYDNPSARHVCYGEQTKTLPYVDVSRSTQQSTCLGASAYSDCARYRKAVARGIMEPAEGVQLVRRRWWWPFG